MGDRRRLAPSQLVFGAAKPKSKQYTATGLLGTPFERLSPLLLSMRAGILAMGLQYCGSRGGAVSYGVHQERRRRALPEDAGFYRPTARLPFLFIYQPHGQ